MCPDRTLRPSGLLGHRVPPSPPARALGVERKTRVKDLALLCANCHRAIHAVRPLPTVEEFAAMLLAMESVDQVAAA